MVARGILPLQKLHFQVSKDSVRGKKWHFLVYQGFHSKDELES